MAVVLSAFCGRQWNNLLLTSIYRWMPAQSSAGTCTEQCSRGQYEINDWIFARTILFEDWGNTKLWYIRLEVLFGFALDDAVSWSMYGREVCPTPNQIKMSSQVVQSFKESLYGKRPHWNCFTRSDDYKLFGCSFNSPLCLRICLFYYWCLTR